MDETQNIGRENWIYYVLIKDFYPGTKVPDNILHITEIRAEGASLYRALEAISVEQYRLRRRFPGDRRVLTYTHYSGKIPAGSAEEIFIRQNSDKFLSTTVNEVLENAKAEAAKTSTAYLEMPSH